MGGSETSATLLSGLTYYLCKTPVVLQKLVFEIRNTFTTDIDINLTATNKMQYLNAVIEEGLRIYPPVASGLYRVPPQGGGTIDGYFVPTDVSLLLHLAIDLAPPD